MRRIEASRAVDCAASKVALALGALCGWMTALSETFPRCSQDGTSVLVWLLERTDLGETCLPVVEEPRGDYCHRPRTTHGNIARDDSIYGCSDWRCLFWVDTKIGRCKYFIN